MLSIMIRIVKNMYVETKGIQYLPKWFFTVDLSAGLVFDRMDWSPTRM